MNRSRSVRSVSAFLISLLFAAIAAAAPIKLSTITVSPGAVLGGNAATGTATLTGAAGHGGAVVTLSSSNTAVATVPASVTVPQGAVSATFNISTLPVNAATNVTITGNYSVNATATFTVTPPAISGLSIAPSSFTAVTGSATGTVTLSGAAGSSGVAVSLTHSGTFVTMPSSVTIPSGGTSATFNITSAQIASTTTVTVTATANGNTVVGNVDVSPCVMGTVNYSVTGSTDIVWFDDALPAGMSLGTAQWSTAQHASGSQSLTTGGGTGYQSFQLTGATTPFNLYPLEQAYLYVLPDLCSPPREIMVGWHTTTGQWKKAYVGSALIGGESGAYYAGPVPPSGQWGQIVASAQQLGLPDGAQFDGFSLEISDGHVWIDRVEKSCHQPTAVAPSLPAGDTYWIDDSFPSGTPGSGYLTRWDTTQHASGTQSLFNYAIVSNMNPLPVYIGEKLIAYVLLDYCAPGTEIDIRYITSYNEAKGFYWGASTFNNAGYTYMGPLPSAGQWVRLEIPAAQYGLEERWITGISAYGNAWWDLIGKAGQGCSLPTIPPPSIPAGDTLILEDGGPVPENGGVWTAQQHASGTSSLTLPYTTSAGYHWVAVTGIYSTVTPTFGETLVFYALLDPCATPTELTAQWDINQGSPILGMYWGAPHGIENGYVYMGPLPAAGSWQRFEVPATAVNAQGQLLRSIKFEWEDGNAYFDHVGKGGTACYTAAAAQPTGLSSSDVIWIDDALPTGAGVSYINWDTTQKASGTQSLAQAYASGPHDMGVTFQNGLGYAVGRGDTLSFFVLLDECAPPSEIMFRWRTSTGVQKGAYWGTAHNLGEGNPYISMGALPAAGVWTRMDISAAALGLEQTTIQGIDLISYDGHTFFDRIGKVPCVMPLAAAPTFPAGDTVWIDDSVPPGSNDVPWSTTQHAQGTRSIGNATATTGTAQIGMDNINPRLPVYVGERLVLYALVDSCPNTTGISVFVGTTAGDWIAAYWGTASGLEPQGSPSMGPVPAAGQWTRLEIPASALRIEERDITHIVLQYTGGRVWFDHIGKAGNACAVATPSAPTFPAGDTVWIDDNAPSGWNDPQWSTLQAASGTRSIGGYYAQGNMQQFSTNSNGSSTFLPLYVGEKIVFYALIDECAPAHEIALFVQTTAGEYKGVYWGALSGGEGMPMINMGALPATGGWRRFEVPASTLRMEERLFSAFNFWADGHVWIDRVGKGGTACITATAAHPTFPAGDTVWFDETPPAGWTPPATDTTQAASGTKSIGGWYGQGDRQTFALHADGAPMVPIYVGEKFIFYVLIDECAPPSGILAYFRTSAGDYRSAYWGALRGDEGGNPVNMGALPPAGVWTRMEVPASALRIEERMIDSYDFWINSGHAWFDHVGKAGNACITATAAQPTFPAGDTVWFDETPPTGWTMPPIDTTQAASGTKSIGGWYAEGDRQTFALHADGAPMVPIYVGEKFIFYVLIDECAPPSGILAYFRTSAGDYRSAYWGALRGDEGGNPVNMGAMPPAGVWTRMEVPASALRIEDRMIDSYDFWTNSGHAWFDHVGKAGPACITATAAQPTFPAGDTVWFDETPPTGWTMPPIDTTQAASGTKSIGGWYGQGDRQTFALHADGAPMVPIYVGEKFIFYTLVDECAPPSGIVVFFRSSAGDYRSAYWGALRGDEPGNPVNMGARPPAGVWTRLEVPASALRLEDRMIDSYDFWTNSGHAWFDHVGKAGNACITATAAQPTFPAGDTVWVDDSAPSGWNVNTWDTTQAASGTKSIGGWYAEGDRQTFSVHADGAPTVAIAAAEKVVVYALLDECAPPAGILIGIRTTAGDYRSVSWGALRGDEPGAPANQGAVPAGGQWTRLEVPLSAFGIIGDRDVDSFDFWVNGGHAWFDRLGKAQ